MVTKDDRGVSSLVQLAQHNLSGHTPVREEVLFARFEARASRLRSQPTRPRWIWASAFSGAMAVAALLLFVAMRAPALTYEVVGGAVSKSGYVVGGSDTHIRFSDGSELSLERGAETRVTDLGSHGGTVSVEKGGVRVAIAKKPQAAWTVGRYPTDWLTARAAHRRHSGSASTHTTRRHQRVPRQPPARMTTATTVNPIQIDNDSGAASPMPVELMYQPTTPAATAPTSPALGTHTSRHHRDRQPTAAANAAAAITWTVHGSQPWINDTS